MTKRERQLVQSLREVMAICEHYADFYMVTVHEKSKFDCARELLKQYEKPKEKKND